MKRRNFLKQTGAVVASATFPHIVLGVNDKHQPPNVILILTDDQGWGDIHAHGNDNWIHQCSIDYLWRVCALSVSL